jgi:hypothetical protein
MHISYFYIPIKMLYNEKRTLKQKIINLLQIINLPIYFWNLCFAIALNRIFNILFNNKSFETTEKINRIYFKNVVYLRTFKCNKFIPIIQVILEVLFVLYVI